MMNRRAFIRLGLAGLLTNGVAVSSETLKRRRGRVRLLNHSLVDDSGPFLGLGASYFSALHRCKYDHERLKADLDFLSRQGFNYIRILSMVGWNEAWEGREIAPISFANRKGEEISAWSDYWSQLGRLIDLAYDRYGLRTQVTIFADAQLMPEKAARLKHLTRLLHEITPGRERKILLLEVANEAWQNGFPGSEGVADLRDFTGFLADRTEILVATTSNHENDFDEVYAGSHADIATWHFSRDRSVDQGWKPVYDCWELGDRANRPPVSSNEPIGPGSSVNAERDPLRLVAAAAFAYLAKLPMYVFHSEAGVFGRSAFEEMPGIRDYRTLLRLLPGDVASWKRTDARGADSLFTIYARGEPDRYSSEAPDARDGCIRMIGTRQGERFYYLPIGIQGGGLRMEARKDLNVRAVHLLTGDIVAKAALSKGEAWELPQGVGAYLLIGALAGHAIKR
jgi:hypothetical protein